MKSKITMRYHFSPTWWEKVCKFNKALWESRQTTLSLWLFFFFGCAPFYSLFWICHNIASVLCFCVFGKACEILTPQPGIEPTLPTLEGKVFTIGPSGKYLSMTLDGWVNWHSKSIKTKVHISFVWLCSSSSRNWPCRYILTCPQGCLFENVHSSSLVCSGKKVERTQMSINRRLDK